MYIICPLIPSSCYCIEYSLVFILWKWHMSVTDWNRCSCMILMRTVRKIFQHKFQYGKVVNKFQQIKSLLNEKNCIKMDRNWMKQMLSLDIPPKISLHTLHGRLECNVCFISKMGLNMWIFCGGWHQESFLASTVIWVSFALWFVDIWVCWLHQGSKHIQKELVPLLRDRLNSMLETVRLPLAMTHLQGIQSLVLPFVFMMSVVEVFLSSSSS